MGKKKVDIKVFDGETPNSKIYVLEQNISGFSTYERAKAIDNFIDRETRVLETCISNDIREFLHNQGISIEDGSKTALQMAFLKLKTKGKEIVTYDRYKELNSERIIGESESGITVILEDDILSSAIEVDYE